MDRADRTFPTSLPAKGLTPRRRAMLRAAVAALIIAGFSAVGYLSLQLSDKIQEMREVPKDNVQWNLSQLEVDFLKMLAAGKRAEEDPAALEEFRKRFDVFYSRLTLLSESADAEAIDMKSDTRHHRAELREFLDETVGFVDASDAVLIETMPQINAYMERLSDMPRRLSLGAIEVTADMSDRQRQEIFDLLRWLGGVSLFVVGLLFLTFVAMMLQRVELSSRARKIAKASQMQDSTLRASLDAIVVANEEGRITDFNGSAEKVFGLRREDAVGRLLSETIVPPSFREAHEAGMSSYTSPYDSSIIDKGRLELTAMHANGHEFPIEISITEVATNTGINFISYIRDITEEKRNQAELQDARDRALTAYKEKSRFFAVMSHEMRTPLNGIMSALNLLSDADNTPEQKRYIHIAETSGNILLGHINDVLTIERLDSGTGSAQTASFYPGAALRNLADSMRPLAEAQNTSLSVEGPRHDIPLLADERALNHVVTNLLSNAIKFTQSGAILLKIDLTEEDENVGITVDVTDTGVGISPEDCERVFDDFVTVDLPYERNATGTGLGLGIARRMAGQLNGTLTCESELRKGSTFRFTATLPKAHAPTRLMATEENEQPGDTESLDILVVEDNPINSELLEALLRREGHRVSLASDGFEGVHLASKSFFDLILMDISMPNMNGIKATQQIRDSGGLSRNTPIYAVTAHAMPAEIEEFKKAGMRGCLLKPIQIGELRKILAETTHRVSKKRKENAPAQPAFLQRKKASDEDVSRIDEARLSEMLELLGSDAVRKRVAKFITDVAEGIATIEKATAAGALDDVQANTHKLSGSSALFGATGLHALMRRIEVACKEGRAGEAKEGVSELSDHGMEGVAALEEAVQRLTAA